MKFVVIDTNIALDLWVFDEPAARPLHAACACGELQFLRTAPMRNELERVLGYNAVQRRLLARCISPDAVLALSDAASQEAELAPKCSYTCLDADDQMFLDLAAAHQVPLISKDAHVLSMTKRMARLGVAVSRNWAGAA